jgi:hypothetical protein
MSLIARSMAGVLLLGSASAMAQEGGGGFIDAFFVPSADIEFPDLAIEDDGTGFGFRGVFPAGSIAVTAGYQGNSYEGGDVSDLRLGVGVVGPSTSGVFVEYTQLDLDIIELDGLTIRGRLAGNMSDQAQLYGELGYMMLKDDDFDEDWVGLEFTVGAIFGVTDTVGFFVDLHQGSVELEDDNFDLVEMTDIRAGVRIAL